MINTGGTASRVDLLPSRQLTVIRSPLPIGCLPHICPGQPLFAFFRRLRLLGFLFRSRRSRRVEPVNNCPGYIITTIQDEGLVQNHLIAILLGIFGNSFLHVAHKLFPCRRNSFLILLVDRGFQLSQLLQASVPAFAQDTELVGFFGGTRRL